MRSRNDRQALPGGQRKARGCLRPAQRRQYDQALSLRSQSHRAVSLRSHVGTGHRCRCIVALNLVSNSGPLEAPNPLPLARLAVSARWHLSSPCNLAMWAYSLLHRDESINECLYKSLTCSDVLQPAPAPELRGWGQLPQPSPVPELRGRQRMLPCQNVNTDGFCRSTLVAQSGCVGADQPSLLLGPVPRSD